jgi:hypothetical protein
MHFSQNKSFEKLEAWELKLVNHIDSQQNHFICLVSIQNDRKLLDEVREAKLSREQLAELVGVGKTVMYDLEKGKQNNPFSRSMKE